MSRLDSPFTKEPGCTVPAPRARLPGLFAATLLLAACSTTGQPGTPVSAAPPPGQAPTFIKTIACGIGGLAGAAAARSLAQSDAKRQRLTPAQLRQREQGYMVSLALLGCAGGSALAGTAYQKLSERGRAAREAELREAASSAQPRTYVDPDNPTLVGRIVPQPAFVEGGQECRVIEDTLADAGKGEPIFVKYCRRPPASAWAPVLA